MRCPREGSLRRTRGIDLGPPFRRRALQGRIDERQRYIWIFERSMPDVSIGTREHDLAAASQHLVASTRKEFWVLPASVWVKVEPAAMEVDRGLEVLAVAEATGGVADPLDLRVEALGRRVGNPVAQVGKDVRQVRLEHPRLLDHGLEPRVGRPEVPVAEKPAGGPDVAVLPQVRGRLLERPGAGDLERAVA